MLWIPIRKSTENLSNLITNLNKHYKTYNIKPDGTIVLTSVTDCPWDIFISVVEYLLFLWQLPCLTLRTYLDGKIKNSTRKQLEGLNWNWDPHKTGLGEGHGQIGTELKTNRRENCQSCWLLCSSRWNLSLRMTKVWQMTQFKTVFTKLFHLDVVNLP